MASSALTIDGSWYSASSYYDWDDKTTIYSGFSNSNYWWTKIKLSVPSGLTIIDTTKLVLQMELKGLSSPEGCLAVLSTQEIAAKSVQADDYDGPSSTLVAAALAQSRAYLDSNKTSLAGINVAIGTNIYFVFSGMDIGSGDSYYVYLLRSIPENASTTTGFVQSSRSDIVATLHYENYTKASAPTSFTATPNPFEDKVTLKWSGAKAGTNNAINGYLIQYRDSSDGSTWGSWTTLKTVSATATSGSTTDTPGIARGAYRQYRIRTQGAAGSSYYSGYSTVTPSVQKNRLPVAPTSLTVSSTLIASGSEVTVSWSDGSDDDGNLSGYVLECSSDGGSTYSEVYTGSDLSYKEKLTGSAAQQFRYRIRAKDSLGALSSSYRYSGIITINSSPVAPTSAYLDKEEYSPGDKITLTWSGATDADNNIAQYIIGFRYDEADNWTTHGSVPNTTGSGSYEFQPQNAEYLQRIYMAVRAVDALGATSEWKSAGSVLRNDNPYAYIRSDSGGAYAADTDKHLVSIAEVAGEPSSFSRYMPYVFDGESWQRCIE